MTAMLTGFSRWNKETIARALKTDSKHITQALKKRGVVNIKKKTSGEIIMTNLDFKCRYSDFERLITDLEV